VKRSVEGVEQSYRSKFRSFTRINKRFRKRVAESLHPVIRYTDVENVATGSLIGACAWAEYAIGDPGKHLEICTRVLANSQQFGVAETNTSAGPTQDRVSIKIRKFIKRVAAINSSTNKIHIEVYTCTPRFDNYRATPIDLLADDQNGNLLNGTPIKETLSSNVNFSPFMCPFLLRDYHVYRTRKFTVAAGGKFYMSVSNGNYTITPGTSYYDNNLVAKQYQAKYLLVKTYGELGVVNDDGASVKFIRYLKSDFIGKVDTIIEASLSAETRKIYTDDDTEKNNSFVIAAQGTFINEETNEKQIEDHLKPTTLA